MNKSRILFLLIAILQFSCKNNHEVKQIIFQSVSHKETGIHFRNDLIENDTFNIIEYLYFYNGGGVAIGDINNDGLADIYFSSNQHANKLYLNKGNFKFEDITSKAGVSGEGNWKTGISMVDINADGLLDIYVCGVGNYKSFDGFNQLFVNNGDLTFTERAKDYGLYFNGFSTQASFFDYDLDGDLDMYLLNHSVHSQRTYGKASLRYDYDSLAGDRFYKNEFSETGKTFFKDVTKEAGILSSQIGYGLGIGVSDINRDGYPDIYVSNDFSENDYLYINQKNGKFLQQSESSFSHTSRFSMGNDISDINNDLWPDIITTDMLPKDESVIKTSQGEDSYEVYKFKLGYGFGRQVSRNALQLNRGVVSQQIRFTDIAPFANIEATDWSWCPLIFDFDGDGHKDVFVANGISKRPNDLDYLNFISNDSIQRIGNKNASVLIDGMPNGMISNFMYQNNGDLTFEDVTTSSGLFLPSISNGAAYGDLDNDGDPDFVVNQLNAEALIYQNNSTSSNFVSITLKGDSTSQNKFAIGAKVIVSQGNQQQAQELFPVRGWCSSSDYNLTFGLGEPKNEFEVKVIWPTGKLSVLKSRSRNIVVNAIGALSNFDYQKWNEISPILERSNAIQYTHSENDFNAFNREALMPHMQTTEGPPIAKADIDDDGLQDVFIGGGKGQSGEIFKQTADGKFVISSQPDLKKDAIAEDVDAAFFDADGDGDQDLVVVSGGQEEMRERQILEPRLYLNDGGGKMKRLKNAIGNIYTNASCVKPADYDNDGDIDLFIGSSVMPFLYGMSPVSFLLQNNGKGQFTPDFGWLGSSQFDNPTRVRPGLVKDAQWADINKDGLLDLVIVGEWMPITILLQNKNHQFENSTGSFGLDQTHGWWNSVIGDDFDNDGDIDFVVGNLGLNSRIRVSREKPLLMYLGDFDSNGSSDHILVYYNGDNSYPFASRDQLVRQIPSLKRKFLKYKDYRDVKLEDIITPMQKGNSAVMKVNSFTSLYLRNDGARFSQLPLPSEAQLFPIFGISSEDVNADGNKDLLLVGNLSAVQPEYGAYDAGLGLVLLGDGNGGFDSLSPRESGFVVDGEGRDIEIVKDKKGELTYLVTRNNDSILSFKKSKK